MKLLVTKRALGVRQNAQGSSLAEFGPALGILLLAVFFPMLDLVMLAFSYSQCVHFNSLQLQKAAEMSPAEALNPSNPAMLGLVDAWQHTGLAAVVKLAQPPATSIVYQDIDNRDKFVVVSTTFSLNPFLMIPVLPGVPGMGAPATFTVSSKRVLEDPS